MFDQNFNTHISTISNINAVSGTLIKSHTKSIILHCSMLSTFADHLFSENPEIISKDHQNQTPVVVLQAMLCGENQLLVEVITKSDFEAIYSAPDQKEEKEEKEEEKKKNNKIPPERNVLGVFLFI